MKKALLTFLAICLMCTTAFAEEQPSSPSCVFIKFSNDTRFQETDAAPQLSELVMERLLASGKFYLTETKPIDKDMEKLLYDEKSREMMKIQSGMASGNFNELFESAAFDSNQADSVATAQVGQKISPSITSAIGRDNNADYLIQGTIINMGKSTWTNKAETDANMAVGFLIELLGKATGLSTLQSVGGDTFYKGNKTTAIALQCDLRVIKAETGEVVWSTNVASYLGVKAKGKRALSEKIDAQSAWYADVFNVAANDISKALIKALDDGKLFGQ